MWCARGCCCSRTLAGVQRKGKSFRYCAGVYVVWFMWIALLVSSLSPPLPLPLPLPPPLLLFHAGDSQSNLSRSEVARFPRYTRRREQTRRDANSNCSRACEDGLLLWSSGTGAGPVCERSFVSGVVVDGGQAVCFVSFARACFDTFFLRDVCVWVRARAACCTGTDFHRRTMIARRNGSSRRWQCRSKLATTVAPEVKLFRLVADCCLPVLFGGLLRLGPHVQISTLITHTKHTRAHASTRIHTLSTHTKHTH